MGDTSPDGEMTPCTVGGETMIPFSILRHGTETWVLVEVERFVCVCHGFIHLLRSSLPLLFSVLTGECEVVFWIVLRLTLYVHLLTLVGGVVGVAVGVV